MKAFQRAANIVDLAVEKGFDFEGKGGSTFIMMEMVIKSAIESKKTDADDIIDTMVQKGLDTNAKMHNLMKRVIIENT